MSYAGNPSLNEETKARIRTTFGQTLQLAQAGRLQEASLGCDFILKMDPQFDPARSLLERLDGASGPVDVSDLAPAEEGGPAAPSAAPAHPGGSAGSESDEELPPLPPTAGVGGSDQASAENLDLLGSPSLGEGPSLSSPALSDAGLGQPDSPPADAMTPSAATPSPGSGAQGPGAGAQGDDERIRSLLDEGQSSFEAGAYQAAIDAWSRIFLIDIDHEEASQRIEEARRHKDEADRQVDETFHDAVDQIEAGNAAEGKRLLEEVLADRPDHVGARDQLAELESREAEGVPLPPAPPEGAVGDAELDVGPEPPPMPDSEQLTTPPSGPSPSPAAVPPQVPGTVGTPPAAGTSGRGRFLERRFLYIGAGALLVVLGIGGFLYSNWGSLFPNAPTLDPVETAAPVREDANPLRRARELWASGDTDGALAILDAVPESSNDHARALEQAQEWRGLQQSEEAERMSAQQTQAEEQGRREALLESARRLYAEGEFLAAAKRFNTASKIAPLDGPAAELFEDAKRQLLPIQQQITLFRQGEWQRMQPALWRVLEAEPGNRDARSLLADSYFNLGVEALRRGDPDEALQPLREANSLDPEDPLAQRLLLLAESYAARQSLDPLYNIFVEELDYRR